MVKRVTQTFRVKIITVLHCGHFDGGQGISTVTSTISPSTNVYYGGS